jgi:lipoprotein-anchoring transpeptidase ErfK/SrfK
LYNHNVWLLILRLEHHKSARHPKFAWKDVKAKQKLTVQPEPNNLVGLVWIDLTAPSYGIHGTPEPKSIGKTESHGCIRLTNRDAVELAGMFGRGQRLDTGGKAATPLLRALR